MANSLNIVIFALLIAILIWKVRIANKGTLNKDGFSLDSCKSIQGYFGLLIIIHHIYTFLHTRYYNVSQIEWSSRIGVYLIGFFFFCSGYGLVTSFHTKTDYIKGFMVKRVLIVLVPFFICNYAYMFVEQVLGKSYSMHELFCSFFGLLLLNSQMWFAVEIMFLYLLFFVLFKYIRNEKISIIIISALVMIMTFISMKIFDRGEYINWFIGEWWYNTTPLFIIGMIVAGRREQIREIVEKYYWLLVILSAVGFVLTCAASKSMLLNYGYWTHSITDKLLTYIVQVPSVIFFEMLIILIMKKIKVGNPCLAFLGKFSLEVLLVSGVFLDAFLWLLDSYGFVCYLCLTFVCTILSAILLYKLKRFILEIK